MVTVPLLVVIMALPVIETVFPPGLLIIGLAPMLIDPEVPSFTGIPLNVSFEAVPLLMTLKDRILARTVREALMEHWRVWGLPTYAQFDNDTIFQGPHQYPDVIGSVIRLCLSLSCAGVCTTP